MFAYSALSTFLSTFSGHVREVVEAHAGAEVARSRRAPARASLKKRRSCRDMSRLSRAGSPVTVASAAYISEYQLTWFNRIVG